MQEPSKRHYTRNYTADYCYGVRCCRSTRPCWTYRGGSLAALGVGTVGGAAVQVPFFYGSNRERQKEAIESGDKIEMDEGAAFLASLPQAAFDTVSELILLRVGATPKAIANGLFTKAGAKEVAGIAATGAGKGVLLEAPTEIGQQMIERAQAGLSIDSEEAIDEYIEAGIAGGLVGGVIRGVADPITARRDPEAEVEVESDPSSLAKEETKKVLEGEQEVLDQLKDEKQMQLLPTTIEELEAIEKEKKEKTKNVQKVLQLLKIYWVIDLIENYTYRRRDCKRKKKKKLSPKG